MDQHYKLLLHCKAADKSSRRSAKLSANENPLGTSTAAHEAAANAISDLSTYPDPGTRALRECRNVSPDDNDQGLALAAEHLNGFAKRTFSKIHSLAAERIGWGYAAAKMMTC